MFEGALRQQVNDVRVHHNGVPFGLQNRNTDLLFGATKVKDVHMVWIFVSLFQYYLHNCINRFMLFKKIRSSWFQSTSGNTRMPSVMPFFVPALSSLHFGNCQGLCTVCHQHVKCKKGSPISDNCQESLWKSFRFFFQTQIVLATNLKQYCHSVTVTTSIEIFLLWNRSEKLLKSQIMWTTWKWVTYNVSD